ncbi:MAG TPA: imidazolonepropionase [Actinomycetota bacterium]|nr:imidazolonepropionase [Actinomycetota bacterium]
MTRGSLIAPLLATPRGPAPRRGAGLGDVEAIADAALVWDDEGIITFAGPAAAAPPVDAPARVGGAVVPGFVDCHTHLPFIGWRADEFEARLAGVSYRDLHGEGGIYRSAALLSGASDDEVLAFSASLAGEMAAHGTTAVELKTGYGLSVDAELRQARLARRLAETIPQTATVTLLACHAVPHGTSRQDWVRAVLEELLPTAAVEGLVDAVDVYVEDIAFGVDDFRRVAEAAAGLGLAVRCHADQLGGSGAAEAAAAVGARNADHLNHVSAEGVAALGGGTTAAGLLPVADQFTREPPPPVDQLIEAGAALVLATDLNPGTCPCLSMPEVISAAATLYRLSPSASLTAATLNAAWALGLDDRLGSLEVGKRADFVVLDAEDPAMIPYRPGHNPVRETWIGGLTVAPPSA